MFTAATTFEKVESRVNNALAVAQATFKSQADAGSSAFGPVEIVVIIAAVIMAAASAWGLSTRLGEYR